MPFPQPHKGTSIRGLLSLGFLAQYLLRLAGGKPSRPPLWEPSAAEYFGSPEGAWPIDVDRVRDISSEDLEQRVRRGVPFVVEDAGRGNPFVGRECTWFHERFPEAKMRAEYTGGGPSRFISLGGKKWLTMGRKTKAPPGHLAEGTAAFNAPYVWHVKDGGEEAPPAVRAEVQRMWRPAYFLQGSVNIREANESQEFWFSLRNGSVMVHADTYCIPAVSLQLRGTKRWRLMPAPPTIRTVLDRYDSGDGGLYNTGLWRPMYEANVSEGEALIFFPSQFHETFVPGAGNPQCTVASTFQFQHPLPVHYLNAFLPTLSNSHLYYDDHCKDLWHAFSTFEPPGEKVMWQPLANVMKLWPASIDEQAVREQAQRRFREIDADSNAVLSAEEVQVYLAAPQRNWARWFLTEDYFYDWRPGSVQERERISQDVLQARAKDTLHYHDLNEDGAVTMPEFLESTFRWNVVHHKLKNTHNVRAKRRKVSEIERGYDRFRPQRGGHAAPTQTEEL